MKKLGLLFLIPLFLFSLAYADVENFQVSQFLYTSVTISATPTAPASWKPSDETLYADYDPEEETIYADTESVVTVNDQASINTLVQLAAPQQGTFKIDIVTNNKDVYRLDGGDSWPDSASVPPTDMTLTAIVINSGGVAEQIIYGWHDGGGGNICSFGMRFNKVRIWYDIGANYKIYQSDETLPATAFALTYIKEGTNTPVVYCNGVALTMQVVGSGGGALSEPFPNMGLSLGRGGILAAIEFTGDIVRLYRADSKWDATQLSNSWNYNGDTYGL